MRWSSKWVEHEGVREAVDFKEKDEGETDFVSWMRREREFWEVMENVTTVETPIYDIVAAFSQKLLQWKNHLHPLKKKGSVTKSSIRLSAKRILYP